MLRCYMDHMTVTAPSLAAGVDYVRRTLQVPLGHVEPMSRGKVNWLMTIPEDGRLPLRGIAPTLIEWRSGTHPADTLRDTGCLLVGLEGFHPDAATVSSVLDSIGFQGDFRVSPLPPGERAYLVADIQTPAGPRRLSAPHVSAV